MALYYPPTSDFIQKTLGADLLSGVTAAATLNNVTAIQNKAGVMIIDRIDTNNNETPSKVEVISFAGTSGSTVTTLVRGLAGTTDQDHAVGAIVEFGPDIVWAQGIIDTLLVEHNDDGTHKSALVTTLKATGAEITTGTEDAKIVTPKAIADAGIIATTVTETSTTTLTNKRITKRTGTTTSHATPTINTDNVDFYSITAQAEDITSMTTNLSGTPTENQTLWIAITGTAARAITWGASFENGAADLPTTTVTTQRLDIGLVWNTVTSKWRCMAVGPTS